MEDEENDPADVEMGMQKRSILRSRIKQILELCSYHRTINIKKLENQIQKPVCSKNLKTQRVKSKSETRNRNEETPLYQYESLRRRSSAGEIQQLRALQLEKEAKAKGIQAVDIEIPPPCPKRKPNAPYPRKPGPSAKLVSSSHCNQGFLDVPSSQKTSTGKENQDENCSGVTKYPLPNNASADNETSKASNVDNNMVQEKNKDRDDDDDGMHSAREHFPVDFVNGNVAKYPQFHPPGMVSPDLMFCPMGDLVHVNHPATRASSSYATTSTTSQQAFPACPSQDDYRSFLHMSSTFSNLIMSTLLQNPAAHAAATLAASVWPYTNNVGDSSTQMSSSPPSIAAIVAATVAAATAWWASHGLLPPTPLHLPVPTPNDQLIEKQSTAFQDQNMASSSDDSEETGITKLKAEKEEVVVAAAAVVQDSQKKNPVDRSSCGLNTPSGSDAEIDALDKMEKEKRGRWSIAFQALFARERLPQSFSPPQVAENQKKRKQSDTTSIIMPLAPPPPPPNLNKIQDSCNADQESAVDEPPGSKSLKLRETGFKPYKRCSMEAAKESQVETQTIIKVMKRSAARGFALKEKLQHNQQTFLR
ncbi:unnamed protein product [Brassica napus]|uniref:(rape) hypothetical protein n=1 Tax=Brassica napus TaxID=3708 RepID=A0A816LEM4_BRANA|nr:unnamed protein product [Brassica napus]